MVLRFSAQAGIPEPGGEPLGALEQCLKFLHALVGPGRHTGGRQRLLLVALLPQPAHQERLFMGGILNALRQGIVAVEERPTCRLGPFSGSAFQPKLRVARNRSAAMGSSGPYQQRRCRLLIAGDGEGGGSIRRGDGARAISVPLPCARPLQLCAKLPGLRAQGVAATSAGPVGRWQPSIPITPPNLKLMPTPGS